MIATTYALSGLLLGVTAMLFVAGLLDAASQTLAWSRRVLLRVGRGELGLSHRRRDASRSRCGRWRSRSSIALGTGIGGIGAPWLFGALIGTGEPVAIAWGYALGAVLMMAAGGVALWLGVDAERKPLEAVARPLSSVD